MPSLNGAERPSVQLNTWAVDVDELAEGRVMPMWISYGIHVSSAKEAVTWRTVLLASKVVDTGSRPSAERAPPVPSRARGSSKVSPSIWNPPQTPMMGRPFRAS